MSGSLVDDEPSTAEHGELLAEQLCSDLLYALELDTAADKLTLFARTCAEQLPACSPGVSMIQLLSVMGDPAIGRDGFVDEAVLAGWDRIRAWIESQFYGAVRPFLGTDDPFGSQVEAVRCALGLSRQGATNVVLIARRLAETFPTTLVQLRAGKVTHKHVWALIESTRALTEDEATKVEASTAGDAPTQTVAEYRKALDRARAVVVPDFAERQAKARVTGRGVSRWTDRTGQPKLLANLPAEDLAAAWEALTARADEIKQPDDPRAHAARMADALTEALTGRPAAYDPRRDPNTPATSGASWEKDCEDYDAKAPERKAAKERAAKRRAQEEAGAAGGDDSHGPSDSGPSDSGPSDSGPSDSEGPGGGGTPPAPTPPAPPAPPTTEVEAPVEIHVVVPLARLTGGPLPDLDPYAGLTGLNRRQRRAARKPLKGRARRGRVLTSRSFAVIGIDALLGRNQLPGELSGNGWVSSDVIRRLAAGNVLLRRLVIDAEGRLLDAEHTIQLPAGRPPDADTESALLAAPYRAAPLDYGTTVYRMPAELARFIALRDRTCQSPGCHQPAWRCDCDHAIPFPRGSTSAANCGTLCRFHHRLKTHAGWDLVRHDDGTTSWTSPAGQTRLRAAFNYSRYLS